MGSDAAGMGTHSAAQRPDDGEPCRLKALRAEPRPRTVDAERAVEARGAG